MAHQETEHGSHAITHQSKQRYSFEMRSGAISHDDR